MVTAMATQVHTNGGQTSTTSSASTVVVCHSAAVKMMASPASQALCVGLGTCVSPVVHLGNHAAVTPVALDCLVTAMVFARHVVAPTRRVVVV
jgi:hypothetical protein